MLEIDGACCCGAIAYRITRDRIDAGYCHCRTCQRANGAPVVAWVTVPSAGFGYTRGTAAVYRSSAHGTREFCGVCGTPLVFRSTRTPETVDVTVASLDDPSRVAPEYHIWRQSRISWFDTADALPRHDDAGPDR